MKAVLRKQILSLILLFFFIIMPAQDDDSTALFSFNMMTDWVYATKDQMKPYYAYLGFVDASLSVKTSTLGMWDKGRFTIRAINTHGATPSGTYIDDVQVASNIEAGNFTGIQELWYRQKIGDFTFILGQQDLNSDFAGNDFTDIFINSSFGISPTMTGNFYTPIFPLTALGFVTKWEPSENYAVHYGVYDSDILNPTLGVDWEIFRPGNGFIHIAELGHFGNPSSFFSGSYRFGVFYNTSNIESAVGDSTFSKNNFGGYLNIDQPIAIKGKNTLLTFMQIGNTPQNHYFLNSYLSFGIRAQGLLKFLKNDDMGIAIARASINPLATDYATRKNETVLEWTYFIELNDYFIIQPDVQLILNNTKSVFTALRFHFVY